jgi:RES domain
MKCCLECFRSNYLRSIIQSNSTLIGKCDFCEKDNSQLFDPVDLKEISRSLIELYKPTPAPLSIKPDKVEKRILLDFHNRIFSFDSADKIRLLLEAIFVNEMVAYKAIFSEPVCLECYFDPYTETKLKSLQLSWDKFVTEIKNENRFHIKNTLDMDQLKILLQGLSRSVKAGKSFYRGRLSEKIGFNAAEMGNPPLNYVRAGRANPQGISYLYLSSDPDTTIYETRASLFDYITIGEFKLNSDVAFISLRETDNYDPMFLAEQELLSEYLVFLPFINSLEIELSKPIRRNDNELDYIPTQYISEYIKSLGYDGVEYKSSLNPKGYNIAVFNPKKFDCINTIVYEIQEILFKYA